MPDRSEEVREIIEQQQTLAGQGISAGGSLSNRQNPQMMRSNAERQAQNPAVGQMDQNNLYCANMGYTPDPKPTLKELATAVYNAKQRFTMANMRSSADLSEEDSVLALIEYETALAQHTQAIMALRRAIDAQNRPA